MTNLLQPYTALLITAAALSAAMAITSLRMRPTLGTRSFAILMSAVAMWAFVAFFEFIAQDLPTKAFSYSLKYLFIVVVPVAWLSFGLYYANRLRSWSAKQLSGLMVIPLLTLVMVATNRFHQLMFSAHQVHAFDGGRLIFTDFGPWFWVHAAYSYALLLIGFFSLAKSLGDSTGPYRRQLVSVLVGGLTPWACNMLFIFKRQPFPFLDLTPFAFSISGLAFLWGIMRHHLLDIVPIARDIVIHNLEEGIVVVDEKQRILDVNPKAAGLLAMAPQAMIGRNADRIADWWPMIRSARKSKPDDGREAIALTVDGQARWIETSTSRLGDDEHSKGYLVVLRDVTEEKKLQEQLLMARKMEAIGTLAGGIAHDFNNLLMGIQANISLLWLDAENVQPLQEKLLRIEEQIQTGAALTRQLLGYARKGKYHVGAVDLRDLIDDAVNVVKHTKKNIQIEKQVADCPLIVHADRGQIELVLLNLLVNAMDAMPDGGRLTLACRSIGNSDVADHWPDLQPGRYIELTVADTGIGMDALTREHVFEPFFTTKEIGRGTGLGLASVYGVVHSYGGRIRVESRIGQGSIFTIVFPAATDRLPASAKVPRETPAPASGGTLLVVEDEPTILELSLEMVQSLGFKALSATSGEEAVRLYQRHQASIDLVLLDIIMPGMDGWTAFQELKKINAQVKVIITSGYGVTNRKKRILSGTPHGTLQKPYTRATLAKMIAKVLAIPAPAGALPAL